MPGDPDARNPDMLMHGRADGADHPAVPVAAADLPPDALRLRAVPQFIPGLPVQITHDLLLPGAVAGHHIAIGIDEEGVEAHVALQQPLLAVNVVDQTVIEVGPEPFLGAPGTKQLIDQRLEMGCHHGLVIDNILPVLQHNLQLSGKLYPPSLHSPW